jgi:hypothetical protein
MTKKLILPALLLLCTALFSTSGFAQTCSSFTGKNVQYIAIGSSAQFNTFAFAAENLLNANYNGSTGLNFWAGSKWSVVDTRTTLTDGGGKIWIAWDNSADCYVYAYMSFDSTVGVRSFSSWTKVTTAGVNATVGAVYGSTANTFPACASGHVQNAGQPACTGTAVPAAVQTFLTTQAAPACKIGVGTCTSSTTGALPLPYCGNKSTSQTAAHYCFFNAGHADIRPDDTLYATQRAIGSAFNGPTGLTDLGYGSSGCGATGTGAKTIGCVIYEAFGQGGSFNVSNFALSATDPYTAATIPSWVSLNIGAAPVLVFVNDADTTTSGFGNGAPSSYAITNINHKVLAGFEDGTFGCVGDVATTFSGSGNAVQVLQREPLSGTYNTFEFNAVRTLTGSAASALAEDKASSIAWFTDDDSGQELNNNPSTNYNTATCPTGGTSLPTAACGDPKYNPETHVSCANGNASQLRAIGTGEMVKATLGLEATQTSSNPQLLTPDGLGYAFWGYGNFASAATGCGTNSGTVTCGGYLGHYLTVDGIDPLFITPGGANDPTPNPNGAYHPPQCALSSGTPQCYSLPFTHIYDGSYPIWTILRAVTFANKSGATATPDAVLEMIAEAEKAANGVSGIVLDDFVPYFNNVQDTVNGVTPPKGDLNLGVYRTHYKNGTSTDPNNGYAACSGTFTGITMNGASGCTVDAGGDVGGTVFTVQSDSDFHTDWGSVVVGVSAASEIYSLHQ